MITGEQYVDAQMRDPAFLDSIIQQTNWYGSSYATEEQMVLARDEALDRTDLARAELQDFEWNYVPIFQARKAVFDENYGFYNSIDQWSEQDKARIADAGLIPYISNNLKRYFDTLLGEFLGGQTEWRPIGEDQYSEWKAEYMGHLLRSVAQQNNWKRLKFQVTRDGIVGGMGVASAMNDPRDPLGAIKLQRHRPYEFMYHIESATNGSLDDTLYVWRGYYENRARLIWEFPLWAQQIREFNGDLTYQNYPYLETFLRPKVYRKAGESMDFTFEPYMGRTGRNWIFKREFYRRRDVPRFRITDTITGTSYNLESRDQALSVGYDLTEYYKQMALSRGQVLTESPITDPRMAYTQVVDQEIWAGDLLLAVNHSEENQIPYKFYTPEFIDGEVTSYLEHGKDMQRLSNRCMIFIDMLASGIKGKTVVNKRFFPENWDEAKIRRSLLSATEPIMIDDPNADSAGKVIHHIPPNNYGQLAQNLAQFATGSMDQQYGGLNTIGLTENAGESGKAVAYRQQAAAIATIPLREELRYFDKQMGETVAYLSQFMDPRVQLLYVDDDGNPTYRSAASDGIQSISDLRFKIDISEVKGSPTEREAQANRYITMIQQVPESAPAVFPLLLKVQDINASDREHITRYMQEQDRFNKTIQLEQERRATLETEKKWQLKEQELLIEMTKVQIQARNMPKVNLSGKLDGSMPPAIAATTLEWAGAGEADPNVVASDYGNMARMEQAAADLAVIRRNKLMTPAQRNIEKRKGMQPPPMPPSPKDTLARKRKKNQR